MIKEISNEYRYIIIYLRILSISLLLLESRLVFAALGLSQLRWSSHVDHVCLLLDLWLNLDLDLFCLDLFFLVFNPTLFEHLPLLWVLYHRDTPIILFFQHALSEQAVHKLLIVWLLGQILLHLGHMLFKLVHLSKSLSNVSFSLFFLLLLQCYLCFGTSPLAGDLHQVVAVTLDDYKQKWKHV